MCAVYNTIMIVCFDGIKEENNYSFKYKTNKKPPLMVIILRLRQYNKEHNYIYLITYIIIYNSYNKMYK